MVDGGGTGTVVKCLTLTCGVLSLVIGMRFMCGRRARLVAFLGMGVSRR